MEAKAGEKECGLLLTDRRSIFVVEKDTKSRLYGLFGGGLGEFIGYAATSRHQYDYIRTPPEALARLPGSIAIPHESLLRLRVRRKRGRYRLTVEYDAGGVRRTLKGRIDPPDKLELYRRLDGLSKAEARREYSEKVHEAFRRVLPPFVAVRTEWEA